MQKELCSEPVSLFFTPTILRQADELAAARGLSRAALLRSLVAKEAAVVSFTGRPGWEPQPRPDGEAVA